MAFRKANISKEAVTPQTGGGAKYIYKSGIYPVRIQIASLEVGDKGSESINFNVVDEEGNESTLYGLRLTNNDGSDNFGAEIFNRLMVVANLEEIEDPVEETHKLGKDKKETDLLVLKEFEDFECQIRVQEVYSKNQKDEIRKDLAIREFYTIDGAHAMEIVAEATGEEGVEFGKRLAADMEYAENVTYRDGLTAEDIEAWRKSKKSDNKSAGGAKPKTTANKPAGALFKRK